MPPKPASKLPDADSGPPAARRFDQLVRALIAVPRAELERREKEWQRGRVKIKAKRARAR